MMMNRNLMLGIALAVLAAVLYFVYNRAEFSCYCMEGDGSSIKDMTTCNTSVPVGKPGGPRNGCMWSNA